MKVEKKEIDRLNAEIKLTIEKEDYLPDYNQKIQSYQQKSHMKGFRKGKTPISMIKKMYGAATMQESISKILSEKVNEIITGDEFEIIGEPLLINEDQLPEIDHNNPDNYTYEFKLGLEPEFEVTGVDESDSYTKHVVSIDDDLIDEELADVRKRLGTQEQTDEPANEDDIIHFDVTELENGKAREGGITAHFSVPVDKLSDKYAGEVKGKKAGDTLTVNIFELEPNLTKEYVAKYYLKLGEEQSVDDVNPEFKAEIKEVVRIKPAELDQSLFDKYFGEGQVTSEEEAREKIAGYIGDYFNNESVNLLNRQIMEALMEKNEVELPESFLKEWLTKDKEYTDEQFEAFKKELKWRIIKKKLVKRFSVEVKEDEIFRYFVDAVRNYSPYMDENSVKNTVFSLMQNKEQLNSAIENVSSGKLFDAIRENIEIKEKKTDKESFYETVKAVNQKSR